MAHTARWRFAMMMRDASQLLRIDDVYITILAWIREDIFRFLLGITYFADGQDTMPDFDMLVTSLDISEIDRHY